MTRAGAKTALVVGGGGAVGEAAAHALLDVGWRVIATMRRFRGDAAARLTTRGVRIAPLDLAQPGGLAGLLDGVDGAILAPILSLSAKAAPILAAAGIERAVFFSSNNVAVAPEDPTYAGLAAAERETLAALPGATILRPTLIYGDPRLPATARLMRLMRRTPVFPVPGSGRALQQPVFYADLARAAAGALVLDEAAGKIFAIGGPETFTLAAMYRAAAQAAGGAKLIVPTPVWLLRLAQRMARGGLAGGGLDDAQLARVERDKRAVAVDPAPPALAPRTPFAEGLKRLAAALDR